MTQLEKRRGQIQVHMIEIMTNITQVKTWISP